MSFEWELARWIAVSLLMLGLANVAFQRWSATSRAFNLSLTSASAILLVVGVVFEIWVSVAINCFYLSMSILAVLRPGQVLPKWVKRKHLLLAGPITLAICLWQAPNAQAIDMAWAWATIGWIAVAALLGAYLAIQGGLINERQWHEINLVGNLAVIPDLLTQQAEHQVAISVLVAALSCRGLYGLWRASRAPKSLLDSVSSPRK